MAKLKAPQKPQDAAPQADASQIVLPSATNATEVPSTYANTIEILSMNHIDVRIAFNEVIIETGNQPIVKRRANIVMPTHGFMMALQVLNFNTQNLAASMQKQVDRAQSLLQAQIAQATEKQRPK